VEKMNHVAWEIVYEITSDSFRNLGRHDNPRARALNKTRPRQIQDLIRILAPAIKGQPE